MATIDILLPFALNRPFTYAALENTPLQKGQLVHAPFRGKMIIGVVWSLTPAPFKGALKTVVPLKTLPPLPLLTLDFVQWVSDYTLSPLGLVLKMVLSSQVSFEKIFKKPLSLPEFQLSSFSIPPLSADQTNAVQIVKQDREKNLFHCYLLDGVTGSGKTEVYFSVLVDVLKHKKQVLVLLPEIALTTQWLSRFEERFGCLPLQWHSNLTPNRRQQTWQIILKGGPCVVVGARSALFLPFPDLGLIIVDEEHDGSYKQEEQVIYNARDMAIVRAKLSQAPIMLVSATPSLETMVNVQKNRYKCLRLTQRHGGATLPTIQLVDRRSYPKEWITAPLKKAIQETLASQEQVLLFLNRRGYAPLTLCVKCGFRFKCPGCTSWLVDHKSSQTLKCHYCGYGQRLPVTCPDCQSEDSFVPCGPGVERIHELITQLFPQARCAVLTSELSQSPKNLHLLLEKISNHEIDILIGTQILAKGHHFPLITLVGVIDGDLGIGGVDLRACERTYQLLHQVSGRAGREQRPGRVFIQTYTPNHPVMQALACQNRDEFLTLEQEQRELFSMPPFGKLAALIVSGLKEDLVDHICEQLRKTAPHLEGCLILGPVPAPLAVLRGRHRRRFLVKTVKNVSIQKLIQGWVSPLKLSGNVTLTVDIDPYSFL